MSKAKQLVEKYKVDEGALDKKTRKSGQEGMVGLAEWFRGVRRILGGTTKETEAFLAAREKLIVAMNKLVESIKSS